MVTLGACAFQHNVFICHGVLYRMDTKTASELRAMRNTPQADEAFDELCRRAEASEAAVAAAAAAPPPPPYVPAFAARTLFSCAMEARVGMRPLL